MVEHIDPAFTYADRLTTQLQNDLLFNEICPMADDFEGLRRLVVLNRQEIIENRVATYLVGLKLLGLRDADQLEDAGRALSLTRSWFLGAIREAKDPLAVLHEWYSQLQEHLERAGLSELLEGRGVLPPSKSEE